MFGFFRKKKPAIESSQTALHAVSPADFCKACRRRVTLDVLKQLRTAALAAIDERLAEGVAEENEQQKLYRHFLMTTACTEAFAFELRTSEDDVVPVEDWTHRTAGVAQEAAFGLMELHDAGASLREGETLIVPDVMLAGLRLSQPEVLGLPPAGGESVLLATTGLPYSESFDVEMDFMSDMRRIIRPKRSGMVLESGGRRRLLSPEIFIIAETVDGFKHEKAAAENEEGCRFAWAKAVGVLGASPAAQKALSTKLQARILTADRLTVEMDARGRLRPVMLAPRNLRETADDFTPLLGTQEKEELSKYLNSDLTLSGHIPLGARAYVFLSPEASQVAEVMRQVNRRPMAERLSFLANPQRALVEALKKNPTLRDADLDDLVDGVFVETPDFLNERVKMLGEWKPKTLSFGKPVANDWFEDGENRWGLILNGEYVWATEEELRVLLKRTKEAQASGESEVVFQGAPIPVEGISIPDLTELFDEAAKGRRSWDEDEFRAKESERERDAEEGAESTNAEAEPAATLRYGPDIKDNIDQLDFAARRTKRDAWTHPLTGIRGELMPHQQEALEWLKGLWNGGVPGALLADDMGLGKTLQCISFLSWVVEGYKKQDLRPRCLVVAPAGLIANWQAEVEQWAPDVMGDALVLTGKVLNELKELSTSDRADRLDESVWCIATYEAVRNHIDFFIREPWTVMVLDEAQKIKNPVSMITECVKSLETKFTLAMTGTPVENGFLDVWSILDAAVPGVMGSARDFNARWCDDERIEECGRGLHDLLCGEAELQDEEGGSRGVRLMLRRMKTERIKKLPKKTLAVVQKFMPPEQAECYDEVVRRSREASARESRSGLQAVNDLAEASLSPDRLWRDPRAITQTEISRSARLTALFEILDEVKAKREKVVIFVLHLALQRKLALAVRERYGLDHVPGMISGQMNAEKRQAVVRAFQDPKKAGEFDVVILTARAAGTGLTLTAANHVVHLERWWNPAVEDQCSDRCWRIGQTKDVVVHYPLAVLPYAGRRSYDEKLDAFLAMKRSRSENILAPTAGEGATREFIHEMLGDDK